MIFNVTQAKEFLEATRHCHNARDLESGPCD